MIPLLVPGTRARQACTGSAFLLKPQVSPTFPDMGTLVPLTAAAVAAVAAARPDKP